MVATEWYCRSSTPLDFVTWARRANALRWFGSCMMPKQSSTTSARNGVLSNPRSFISGIQVPPCGLPNSRTVLPRSQPAAATRSIAVSAWSFSACGSTPRGSSATVLSSASCASPQVRQTSIARPCDISAGCTGSDGVWEVIGGGNVTQIEHPIENGFRASPAPDHDSISLCASRRQTLRTFSSWSHSPSATSAACSPELSTPISSTITSACRECPLPSCRIRNRVRRRE